MLLLSPACTEMGLPHMAPESLGLSPLGYNFSLHHRSLHEAELLPEHPPLDASSTVP